MENFSFCAMFINQVILRTFLKIFNKPDINSVTKDALKKLMLLKCREIQSYILRKCFDCYGEKMLLKIYRRPSPATLHAYNFFAK